MFKDNKKKICIITVVYNGAKLIEDTILSVINQSYENIEYIIIDGESTDGTIDIIKKYEDKIALWKSESDNGIYDAMNKGIFLSTGEWVLFLNAGDTFYSDHTIEVIADELENCDVLYGNTQISDSKTGTSIRGHYPQHLDWKVIPYCHQSVFVKSSLLKKTLFDIRYKIAADYDQYFRIKNQNALFKSTEQIISNYDNNGYSMTNYSLLLNEYNKIAELNNSGIMQRIKIFFYFLIKKILNRP